MDDDEDPVLPEERLALGDPGKSPLTVEGHIDSLGAFARGLKRRYPRIGWVIVLAIVVAFVLGFIDLNPFS